VVAAVLGAAFLVWTVFVAVDKNDKSVFPPVLPAAIGIAALLLAAVFVYRRREIWAFTMTGVGAIAVIVTLFTSLFPRVMVSSTDFGNSLTVSNSASQHYTLAVMTVVALVFIPLVVLYQGWTYHVFRARVGGSAAKPLAESASAPS
jgi:cytochrome bd ubiquinol oxidase subunit II